MAPLKKGGANFKTHKLSAKDMNVLEFVPTLGFYAFSGIFIAIGVGAFLTFLYKFYIEGFNSVINNMFILFFSLGFLVISYFLFRHQFKVNRFSKITNRYTKGKAKNKVGKNTVDIPLHKIIAIQLIGERVSGSKSNYNSFEMNIVMDDGNRFNVVDHGNLKSLIKDARVLSDFLNVPIWHAESPNG